MADQNIELMAHLMRRAGFGATREQLAAAVAQGYEATVEQLLDQSEERRMGDDLIRRFHPELSGMMGSLGSGENWLYRMATTTTPLREKAALFWHGIFATGYPKVIHGKALSDQIRMFRYCGLGSFRDLLAQLSQDPAMIIWLDNQDNHKGAINENYGRELLELFSMGVGNYTEKDVQECARAFTGWTLGNREYMELRSMRDSDWPYGRISWHFEFRPDDHDDGEKEFLWGSAAGSTATTWWISSASRRPRRGLSPATCTAFSWPMSRPSRSGPTPSRKTRRPLTCWR